MGKLVESGLTTSDLATQWKWHETFRDSSKNMYRTSYTDMIHGKEVSVKSDLPSGYGGHVPAIRHDVLFRNTGFDRSRKLQKTDECRDSMPDFDRQITGADMKIGPLANPNKVFKKNAPWAITPPIRQPPTYRTTPFRILGMQTCLTNRTIDSTSTGSDPMAKTMPHGFGSQY